MELVHYYIIHIRSNNMLNLYTLLELLVDITLLEKQRLCEKSFSADVMLFDLPCSLICIRKGKVGGRISRAGSHSKLVFFCLTTLRKSTVVFIMGVGKSKMSVDGQ